MNAFTLSKLTLEQLNTWFNDPTDDPPNADTIPDSSGAATSHKRPRSPLLKLDSAT